jgi:hypothetical protein
MVTMIDHRKKQINSLAPAAHVNYVALDKAVTVLSRINPSSVRKGISDALVHTNAALHTLHKCSWPEETFNPFTLSFSYSLRTRHTSSDSVFLRRNLNAVKNGIFWDVTPCDSCKNPRFGGT